MKTHDPTAPQAASWASYQQMSARLAERLNRELTRETGLSGADFEILCALTASEGEPVRALALRCRLEWEKSRLSHQLRRMEQRGLVSRHLCDEDSRGLVIRITDAGYRLACEAKQIHQQAVQRYVYDVLTDQQMETLGIISEAVLARLEGAHTP